MLEQPASTKKSTGEPPKILEDIQQVVGVVGGKAVLTCKVSGRPMPDITWTRSECLTIIDYV